MRIALLGDIHGNLYALAQVIDDIEKWQADVVLVAGDILNRGTRPRECWQLITEKASTRGWRIICGNHEEYVLNLNNELTRSSLTNQTVHQHTIWTRDQLIDDLDQIIKLPYHDQLKTDLGTVYMTHGSLKGIRVGIYPEETDSQIAKKINSLATLFCVGHTHRPFYRYIDNTLVVNVGSVGMPFDGDFRSSYVQVESLAGVWHPSVIRLNYDRTEARKDFFKSDFINGSGPLAKVIIREFDDCLPYLADWTRCFQKAVINGEITMQKAVQDYLVKLG